jgi:hypothetical protein
MTSGYAEAKQAHGVGNVNLYGMEQHTHMLDDGEGWPVHDDGGRPRGGCHLHGERSGPARERTGDWVLWAGAILTGVAAISGAVGLLFGDPKAIRQHQIDQALKYNQFMAPVSVNATMSTGRTYSDLDRFGAPRGSHPSRKSSRGISTTGTNTVVPGRTLSQIGGPTGWHDSQYQRDGQQEHRGRRDRRCRSRGDAPRQFAFFQ